MSNVTQQLVSGALSGFASTVCLQPFDLLKTRMQQGDRILIRPRNSSLIIHTARDVVITQGWLGLWRGTVASLLRNIPGVALYMTSLTQLRTLMASSTHFARNPPSIRPGSNSTSTLPTLTPQGNLLAGATARVAVGFLLNPVTVLKARFESNMYAYESLGGAVRGLVSAGPSVLLRGFVASSLRDAPYAGLFVVCYEGIKREASVMFPASSHAHAAFIHSAAGASAGAIATMATHPFDVIKTKIQVRSEDRYNGLLRTVRTIWVQSGPRGYFAGASLRLGRKILSSAIGWAVYEGGLGILLRAERR
ncbi:mitochondrial carrier [Infundibulicybe gibba]|nr:mitochondrial carrier [Infundibulicybe gibba]